MKIWYLSLVVFGLTQCTTPPKEGALAAFNSVDSTRIVPVIIDSLRIEMHNLWELTKGYETNYISYACNSSPCLEIEVNKFNQILIDGDFNEKGIANRVLKFYQINLFKNDFTSNEAVYSELTLIQIEDLMKKISSEINRLERIPKHQKHSDILEYQKQHLNEIIQSKEILAIINRKVLRKPALEIPILVYCDPNCKINSQIYDSILLGYYKVRELDAKEYFNESYAEIFWKATTFSDSVSLKRLDAIEILHPVQFLNEVKLPKVTRVLREPPKEN